VNSKPIRTSDRGNILRTSFVKDWAHRVKVRMAQEASASRSWRRVDGTSLPVLSTVAIEELERVKTFLKKIHSQLAMPENVVYVCIVQQMTSVIAGHPRER
jgi:hypothetical protein